MVWTFQARSREEARSWIDDVRAVVASVNPLVHPWGVPGEIACSTLKGVSPARGRSATDDGEIKISSPFNVQHIASGAAAAVGAAAAAVGVSSPAMAGEMDKTQGPGTGSHYKEIETKVLREVTSLHDLTEKDLEEWRDRCASSGEGGDACEDASVSAHAGIQGNVMKCSPAHLHAALPGNATGRESSEWLLPTPRHGCGPCLMMISLLRLELAGYWTGA